MSKEKPETYIGGRHNIHLHLCIIIDIYLNRSYGLEGQGWGFWDWRHKTMNVVADLSVSYATGREIYWYKSCTFNLGYRRPLSILILKRVIKDHFLSLLKVLQLKGARKRHWICKRNLFYQGNRSLISPWHDICYSSSFACKLLNYGGPLCPWSFRLTFCAFYRRRKV